MLSGIRKFSVLTSKLNTFCSPLALPYIFNLSKKIPDSVTDVTSTKLQHIDRMRTNIAVSWITHCLRKVRGSKSLRIAYNIAGNK